jgi:hypothetical protein
VSSTGEQGGEEEKKKENETMAGRSSKVTQRDKNRGRKDRGKKERERVHVHTHSDHESEKERREKGREKKENEPLWDPFLQRLYRRSSQQFRRSLSPQKRRFDCCHRPPQPS